MILKNFIKGRLRNEKIISIVLASAMTATCAACLSGCGGGASADSADAGEVNVYNWGEYISNGEDDSLDIIEEFENAPTSR